MHPLPELELNCPDCGVFVPPPALSCPRCHCLIHAAELETLARKAVAASNGGDFLAARGYWSQSAALLPAESIQYKSIQARIADLDAKVAVAPGSSSGWKKMAGGLGPLALFLWKFKTVLLGLTKLGTLLSMLVSLGVYWSLYGWVFAVGLVVSIYIHEMGHVVELRRFGIPAGAPMFIPGLGAIIQLRGVSLPPVQDSRIGLAGPIYGLGTAIFCLALYFITGAKTWSVVAHLGGVINLFNLIPVWQLDGARGFHSLTRNQRGTLLALAGVLWWFSSTGMLLLIAIGAGYQLFFRKDSAQEPDNVGFMQFAGLLVALTVVIALAPA